MFRVEKIRKNNSAGLISSFSAHSAAMALVLTMVLGPSNALARRPPLLGRLVSRPPRSLGSRLTLLQAA